MPASTAELSAQDLQQLKQTATNSLYFFCRAILGFDYMTPRVHGPMCAFLERYARRKRLTVPRGFLKTTLGSVGFPIWLCLPDQMGLSGWPYRGPNVRVLIAMKTLPNAMKTINQIRGIFERNDLFRALWPELLPTKGAKWSDEVATVNRTGSFREGTFEAAGIGTTLVSRHYDIIIEDDLVAPDKDNLTGLEAMPTREEIEKAIGWHKLARSLLTSLETGAIINIGTRWCKYDLIQHIIDNESLCEHLEISALTDDGEAIYPERFSKQVLAEIEEEQGTYIFSSQYLNKPYDEARMVFKDEWLQQTWTILPAEMRGAVIVDPAISRHEDACFSVVLAVGAFERKIYVLSYERGHYSPSELIDKMFEVCDRWQIRDVFVEAVAWQEALAHFFEVECKRRGRWLNVDTVRPGHDERKDVRIRGLQPFAQRGALLFGPGQRELKTELRDFPFGKTVDIADALSYAPRVLDVAMSPVGQVKREVHKVETVGDVLDELRRKAQRRCGFVVPVGARDVSA